MITKRVKLPISVAFRSTVHEIYFRFGKEGAVCSEMVRPNGNFGTLSYQTQGGGAPCGAKGGDIFRATRVGGKCAESIDGQRVLSATDTRYISRSPGMGFYLGLQHGATQSGSCAFSQFRASDYTAARQSSKFRKSRRAILGIGAEQRTLYAAENLVSGHTLGDWHGQEASI